MDTPFQFFPLAAQLPELPAGPSLDNVRGPIEVNGGYEAWQIALAALAIFLIAATFLWLYRRAKKRAVPTVDPYTAAMAELDAATQAADDRRFATACANAVRRFIESQFHFPATAQTSAELLARLPLDAGDKERIQHFLELGDRVKFARRELNETQRIELMGTARELIETIKGKETADPA